MPRINLLDKRTAELIAAGEVIERPSSVVKELVENAIDAGATTVTVEIQNGGVKLIRITDNGCGIDPQDIPKAFLRHATSKVHNEDDLYRIATLGFRGEALASVCAVSRVELVSRTPDSNLGYSYRIEGGEETASIAEAGCPVGTSIYVRDLFYNIPARMKFLKKDITEGNAIATLLDRLALSHPEVALRFVRDGQQKLTTPGDGKLLSAIYAVYGREFGAGLVPVQAGTGSIRVSGFVSRPENAKATRTMQHFFINERYVRSVTVMAALEESYKNSLMTGKYPGCVLHLQLPHNQVDVNVHPAKLEVKLTDERAVFDAVYDACRGTLQQMNQGVTAADTAPRSVKAKLNYFDLTNKPLDGEQQRMSAAQYRIQSQPQTVPQQPHFGAVQPTARLPQAVSLRDGGAATRLYMEQLQRQAAVQTEPMIEKPAASPAFAQGNRQPPTQPQGRAPVAPVAEPAPQLPAQLEPEPLQLLGEAFGTYLLAQQEDKLLLVDKHAAHERILFNKLCAEQAAGSVSRQLLLSSVRLGFSKELYDALVNRLDALELLGFLVEDFGGGSLLVREIPAMLELSQLEDTLLEVGEKLLRGIGRPELARTDDLLHSIACKAAVKGGSYTGTLEQKKLLELLQEDPTLRNCPHGRPIMIELSRREIEKMFGRIV